MNNNKNIYNETIEDLFKRFNTNENGLTEEEAKIRLEKNGKNLLDVSKKKSFFARLFNEITSGSIMFLNFLVLFSCVISYVRNDSYIDSIILFIITIVNSILGYFQSKNADEAISDINNMFDNNVSVIRDGLEREINISDIVIGDIVLLKQGDYVPCDGRIIYSDSLEINEYLITSNPKISNKNNIILKENTILSEQKNMVFYGTDIVNGTAKILVCSTGSNTELGKMANNILNKKDSLSPLQNKINGVSSIIVYLVLFIVSIMIVMALVKRSDMFDVLILSVLLMIAGIPESLASIITIILSIGMKNMVKKNILIKKMASVETLGSIDVICSGKSNSLTQNNIAVDTFYVNNILVSSKLNVKNNIMFNYCLHFCNAASKDQNNVYTGNDIDIAILKYLDKTNFEVSSKDYNIKETPFNYETKFMQVDVQIGDREYSFIKGNPDNILLESKEILIDNKVYRIDQKLKEDIEKNLKYMSGNSLEVLALAYKLKDDESFTFLGFVGLLDRINDSTIQSIMTCKNSGITPVLITGNSLDTAISIAKSAGLIDDSKYAIDGSIIDNMTDDELINAVENYKVYARISSNTKLRIVEALQAKGLVVAMIGDGLSDAAAIQSSNVGIGLGVNGTEIVKEVADCIVTDNSFSSIIGGIEEGRRITSNVKKVIMYLMTTNIIEILLIFIAYMFNVEMFTATQIYWINLVTGTIPAIMLVFEKSDENIMSSTLYTKNSTSFFTPFFTIKLIGGVIFKCAIFLVLYFYILKLTDINMANSLLFIFLILYEFLYAISCKNLKKSVLNKEILNNKYLTISIIALSIFQIIILFSSFGGYFIVQDIESKYIIIVLILSIVVFIIGELIKPIYTKLFKDYFGGESNGQY